MMNEVQTDSAGRPRKLLARFRPGWRLGWVEWGFLVLVALALGMRLWELGGRTMHYDEAIHIYASWKLVNSEGLLGGWPWVFGSDYIHSPWMHGPFQIEFAAFIFRIFGDSDFTARLGYTLFGAALVGLPYFLRDYLGRVGALLAGVMLALSPVLLYFSRFGRNDILMAFWALGPADIDVAVPAGGQAPVPVPGVGGPGVHVRHERNRLYSHPALGGGGLCDGRPATEVLGAWPH